MKNKLIVYVVGGWFLSSCTTDWLDVKSDKKMVSPSSLEDVQALMDNTEVLNTNMPDLGEVGSDDIELSEIVWASMPSLAHRNAYVWAKDIFEGQTDNNWNRCYQRIFYANLALEVLDNYHTSSEQKDNLRGTAYFHRAWSYFQMAQLFCDAYNHEDSEGSLGLPLRLESDMNKPTPERSNLRDTYKQIVEDVTKAAELLSSAETVKTRPNRRAAYALLSSVYLYMGEYEQSLKYAGQCLAFGRNLMDYGVIDSTLNFTFPQFNEEVIFHSTMVAGNVFSSARLNIAPSLHALYENDDYRRRLFFRRNNAHIYFKGSYNGGTLFFNGFAVDEIMLNRAECNARLGNTEMAIADLENLLLYRKAIVGVIDPEQSVLLETILAERRKQLLLRGRRWWDLKRLNLEAKFAKVQVRSMGNVDHVLEPNSERYVLPIPEDVIRLSGILQNQRN